MIIRPGKEVRAGRVLSLATDSSTENIYMEKGLDAIRVEGRRGYLWKDDLTVDLSERDAEVLKGCGDHDIFIMEDDGYARLFSRHSDGDAVFMVTGRCNSGCIMCPASDSLRKNGRTWDMNLLIKAAEHLPSHTGHITITGGEPFLVREKLFDLLRTIRDACPSTEVLLLTNGRALSVKRYAEMFSSSRPRDLIAGIPLHGYDAATHDMITRSPSGFSQTVEGIKNLIRDGVAVEIRMVISRLNCGNIRRMAEYITEEFPGASSVKIMAMEMTGSAALNSDMLWLPYSEAFSCCREAIDILIGSGIDVALYNFPLCAIDRNYRMLSRKSISLHKIRFPEACSSCALKEACGGIFSGSMRKAAEDVIPQVAEI